MSKVFKEDIVTAIDIGTTKICALIAQKTSNEEVKVLGAGVVPSEGMQKGLVINVAKMAASIRHAVKKAQEGAGVAVTDAYVGISGAHIRSYHSHGVVPVKTGVVRYADVMAVVEAAKAIPLPEGYYILHLLPQQFIVDGQRLSNPVGIHGVRLEVEAHVILGSVACVQNLIGCCEAAGIKTRDIILEPLASAEAMLSKDERDLGAALLDIGGGTTDLAVYHQGVVIHTMVLPIAGQHFTKDIAIGLCSSLKDAERVKIEHGTVERVQDDQMLSIEQARGFHAITVPKRKINEILRSRAQELLVLVSKEIKEKKLEQYCTSGLVITGGGSLLRGLDILAHEICDMPVRIGALREKHAVPKMLQEPMYATGYGLLLHALAAKRKPFMHHEEGSFKRVAMRMKSWFSSFF